MSASRPPSRTFWSHFGLRATIFVSFAANFGAASSRASPHGGAWSPQPSAMTSTIDWISASASSRIFFVTRGAPWLICDNFARAVAGERGAGLPGGGSMSGLDS